VRKDGLDVHAFDTGLDYSGVSLGSHSFRPIRKPEIAMIIGDGVTAYDAGEIWHLLDIRYEVPVTMMPMSVFNTVDLNRYNTIIFPQGTYSAITGTAREKLKTWIEQGGVAIAMENAVNWFQHAGLARFEMKSQKSEDREVPRRPYAEMTAARGAQATTGAIFEARVDLTHPLLYGYYNNTMPVFKGNNLYMENAKNAYADPLVFTENPLLSGYVSRPNHERAKGASLAGVSVLGRGRIIGFTENLAFRAFWFGTNKLLMNAIYYGPIIEPGASR